MAVTPQDFPPRKRRPSAAAFISPKFSIAELVQSLLLLSQEISNLEPFQYLLRRKSVSVVRKVKLLTILFEELLRRQPSPRFSASAILCFEEMYILLQRIKTTIEDCSNGSKMWLLMQSEFVVNTFHELKADLSTLLDVFPIREVDLSPDVAELVDLIRNQCSQASKVVLDPEDETLRQDVVAILERIKSEIVPEQSKLADVFEKLGLCDSSSCREEMENLEEEVQNQADDKSKSDVIALIGLVRYGKCVLYGGSTPPSRPDYLRRRKSSTSIAIPSDFRCPITIDLMVDPVVVATGQTYDRESISLWIQSGHNTCPKTGQTLGHTNLIPNLALKNLIALWCREQRIPFETAAVDNKLPGAATSKAALEATKMTASYLLTKLSASPSLEAANSVVYELRVLAKTDSDSRTCVAEAGAIPFLARYLGSDIAAANPNLQVNAVTAILNLSILEANKARIMETEDAINGVIEVLQSGATWEAKGNAAATIFSLSGVNSYMKRLGRKPKVIRGLLDLAKDGPPTTKRDALAAILNLAGDRETAARLVEAGAIDLVRDTMDCLEDEAATVLEAVVRRGGLVAIAAAYTMISKLAVLLREGSERARESAAATLVMICRKGGSEAVAELATMPGIERVIWELMGMGTARTKRKAASLLRILRRWAAGLDNTDVSEAYTTAAAAAAAAASNVRSTQIMLPS